MSQPSLKQTNFIFQQQYQEDQEEEGFIGEQELSSSYNVRIKNNKNTQQEKNNYKQDYYDDDSSDEEIDYQAIRHRFSLHLPEANPLLARKKQLNYQIKQQHQNMAIKYQNINDKKENQDPLQKKQRRLSHQVYTSQNKSQERKYKQEQKYNQKFSDLYLYEKYMKNEQQYELIYSKYSSDRNESEMTHNFAGHYINLSAILNQRKQLQMTQQTENHIFQQLKENHKYKPLQNKDKNSEQKEQIKKEVTQDKINKSIIKQDEEIKIQKQQLIFDSKFESGNLMYVFQNNNPNYIHEYDLVICNDINSKGYTQWFFFSISNTQKNQTIKLNLVNHCKKHSLFRNGMKPAIFSVKKNKNEKEEKWERGGNHIRYFQNTILKEETSDNYYYTLSFSYTFDYDDDTVYFAMSYPYQYTKMINHVNNLLETCIKSSPNIYVKKETLCNTISNNDVPLLTITNKSSDQPNTKSQQLNYESKSKRVAIFMARQHPGETVSSFLMQGMIDFLVSDTVEANFLRNKYIFKIIPIVNPDGVIYGNFRCNLSGVDLNRQWNNPNKNLHPSVYYIKNMIKKLRQQEYQIDYFIDLHGHSKKLNSFIYACKMQSDSNSSCIFPMMLSKLNPILHYPSCTFGLESYKENTARGIAWNCGINKPNIFTVETSFFGYNDTLNGGKATSFRIQDLFKLGSDIIKCVFAYYVENICTEAEIQQLSNTLRSYTIIKKSLIVQDIIKNNESQSRQSNIQEDSGSDSNPSADELTVKDKINNVIGIRMAKQIGIANQIDDSQLVEKDINKNDERNKWIFMKLKRKCSSNKSTGSQTKSKQSCTNEINAYNPIQIENQTEIQKSNQSKEIEEFEICDCQENQSICKNCQSQIIRIPPRYQDIEHNNNELDEQQQQYKKQAYRIRVRDFERELKRDQEIKREKEEIYKRRFRITKNTQVNTPKQYNVLINPQSVQKYKSSNLSSYIRNDQLCNSYYGPQNTNESCIDKSVDNSVDQILKTKKEEFNIEDSFNLSKNRFHAQNGLKGINSFKQNNIQNTEGDLQTSIDWFNPLQINTRNQDSQEQSQQILDQNSSRKSGRLYSAINRLSTPSQAQSGSILIQNQKSQLPLQIETKKMLTANGFYPERVANIKIDDQQINLQSQNKQQTTEDDKSFNKSHISLKKQKQNESKNSLINNFSRIHRENSKKQSNDLKLLQSQTTSSCSTQRKSLNENNQIKQTPILIVSQINQGQNNTNDEKQKIKQQYQIDTSEKKLKDMNIYSNQSTIEDAEQYKQVIKQEQGGNYQIKLVKQKQNKLQKNKNIMINNSFETYNDITQNMINQESNTSPNKIQQYCRNGISSANNSRINYFKNNQREQKKKQSFVNITQQFDSFKRQSIENKIIALKSLTQQSRSECKQVSNTNTNTNINTNSNQKQLTVQPYDPNNYQMLLTSFNPDMSHKKIIGLVQQRFNLNFSNIQTPKGAIK